MSIKTWTVASLLAFYPLIQALSASASPLPQPHLKVCRTAEGCGDDEISLQPLPQTGDTSTSSTTVASASFATKNECVSIDLGLERRPDQSFLAIIRPQDASGGNCTARSGLTVGLASSRGAVSPVSDLGNGIYTALVTPDDKKTGEYLVTASIQQNGVQMSKSKTAIVFDQVNERWGQPQAVEGLVNTKSWEDSAFITPDGQYLFIMYLPISPSCVLEDKKDQPICLQSPGAVNETNRPGLISRFAASRLHSDGRFENHCLGVGTVYTQALFQKYSVYVPPMISYGFKRQLDDSFAEPFPIAIDGVSSCTAPSGLEVLRTGTNKAIALMGLVDPASWNTSSEKDYPSLFTAEIKLDQTDVLATWQPDKKRLDTAASSLRLLFGAPLKNRQDNPHAVVNPVTNDIEAVFWDSEHHDEDIFYRVLSPGGTFPNGPWGPVMKTPVFSDPREKEIQPFFDGKVLTVTKRYQIASRDFLGESYADLADSSAWGPERTELGINSRLKGDEVDVLHGVGDPTYAQRDGKVILYFVYMTRHTDGLLDINVGFVPEK